MPIYEFECVPKGHVFDRLQKLSDPDPDVCEVCGEGPVRRRVTAPAFRLAGSGWYETDFKGDKDVKRNLAGDSSAGSSGAESKAESKPESASKTEPSSSASTSTSQAD